MTSFPRRLKGHARTKTSAGEFGSRAAHAHFAVIKMWSNQSSFNVSILTNRRCDQIHASPQGQNCSFIHKAPDLRLRESLWDTTSSIIRPRLVLRKNSLSGFKEGGMRRWFTVDGLMHSVDTEARNGEWTSTRRSKERRSEGTATILCECLSDVKTFWG